MFFTCESRGSRRIQNLFILSVVLLIFICDYCYGFIFKLPNLLIMAVQASLAPTQISQNCLLGSLNK